MEQSRNSYYRWAVKMLRRHRPRKGGKCKPCGTSWPCIATAMIADKMLKEAERIPYGA